VPSGNERPEARESSGSRCESGAIAEFRGIVRSTENGVPISGIDYECHVSMAEAELDRIAREVVEKHDLDHLEIVHRIGFVSAGETSLYVRALARHRSAVFSAAQDAIDRIKQDVPIWKHPVPE
jgi:molybdopterin synthase catalytic subunit